MITPYPKYGLLGFNCGCGLPYAQGLFEVMGQPFCHVKFRFPATVQQPALRQLVWKAVDDIEYRQHQ